MSGAVESLVLAVEIPGPFPRCLSPNARCGWRERARETRLARETGLLAALGALSGRPPGPMGPDLRLAMRWTVHRAAGEPMRDLDNLIGGPLKVYQDGIFDALGIPSDRQVVEIAVRQVRTQDGSRACCELRDLGRDG